MSAGARDFHGLVTVERGNLDGCDRLDLNKTFPKLCIQRTAADSRLQIKTDKGDDPADNAAVLNQLVVGGIGKRGEAQKASVVTKAAKGFSFAACLSYVAANATDLCHHLPAAALKCVYLFKSDLQYRPKQANVRITNVELRRMDAH